MRYAIVSALGALLSLIQGAVVAQETASPVRMGSPALSGWDAMLGTLGVTGALVWYLWYTSSKAFPRREQQFREEAAAERTHHEAQVGRVCESLDRLTVEVRKMMDAVRAR